MIVKVGNHSFESAKYDARADVLYLRTGESRPAARTHASPEGHAIRMDEQGAVIGITIVNAKWLLERDGKVVVTFPSKVTANAEGLEPALAA